jgi:uncharacterized protein
MFYESADNVAEKAAPHFAQHWARCEAFHADGRLLLVGTFADPQRDGSMAVFTTREAADDFIAGDPFIENNVIASWRILEWNEAFSRDPD